MLVGKVNPQTVHAEWTANRRQRQMESVLKDALQRSDITGTLDSLRPADPAYRKLMAARQDLTRLLGQPWLPLALRPTIRPGDRDERLNEVRRRLSLLGELAESPATVTDPRDYDAELESAVMRFQARHGLEADGLIGKETVGDIPERRVTRASAVRVDAT